MDVSKSACNKRKKCLRLFIKRISLEIKSGEPFFTGKSLWVSQKSCKKRTFHLSLVMPSVLGQSGVEVILHMAHSLLSAGNVSFEILERGKVIFNKLKSGAPKPPCELGGCPYASNLMYHFFFTCSF